MKLSSISLASLAIAAEAGVNAQGHPSGRQIPTSYESAVLGRRILALTPLGTLATTFPEADDKYKARENRPDHLGGMPHVLMEYVADCEDNGNPTFLAINVETTFKNVRDGSNISLAQQWTPPYPPDKRIQFSNDADPSFLLNWLGPSEDEHETVPYSAANLPRYSLLGYLEKIENDADSALAECFVKKHPDARLWLPGSRVHVSQFMRLVVQHVYWIGGFGDRSHIGWIPVEEWKRVTRKEWESVTLPGEKKGWDEQAPAARRGGGGEL
ncbi:pyridoxamine 5'-phosphate oxidase-domain-containing protein [Xylaria intraflava]|nr:pyridoxamine 5'-phosphate oxidase-domain-containing protein [Xylaria intraflava]